MGSLNLQLSRIIFLDLVGFFLNIFEVGGIKLLFQASFFIMQALCIAPLYINMSTSVNQRFSAPNMHCLIRFCGGTKPPSDLQSVSSSHLFKIFVSAGFLLCLQSDF